MRRYCFCIAVLILSAAPLYSQDHKCSQEGSANLNKNNTKNGKVILAYRGFEQFLDSEHTWENYQKYVLDPYPAMRRLHKKYREWGLINKDSFPEKVVNISERKYRQILKDVNDQEICSLYDSIARRCNRILAPKKEIDVCFFLGPIKDCLMLQVAGRNTILISIEDEPEEIPLIIIHEYAHCLHHPYRPSIESELLSDLVVSEGVACFFPTLVDKNASIYEGLWMMPRPAVDWCIENEKLIVETIKQDLNKGGLEIEKKYICSGAGFATPPEGFPEKTAYYLGYHIIEKCLKEISLKELCSMDSDEVIAKSRFFNPPDTQAADAIKHSYYRIKANKMDLSAVDSFPQKIVKVISDKNPYGVEIQSHATNLPAERFNLIKTHRYSKDANYPDEIAKYLEPAKLIECKSPEISKIVDSLTNDIVYTYDFIEAVLKFVSSSIKYDDDLAKKVSAGEHYTQSALETLHSKKGTCSEYTNLFLAIVRNAGIPARFVIGVILLPDGNQIYHAWAECYIGDVGWMPVEIQNGNTWIPDWGVKLFAGKDFKHCKVTLPDIQADIERINK
jgi:hypothetical protein